MIGPFKPAPGNFKFVFVLIDKFSKWIEYMPLVKATSEKAVEFLSQIIHRFGIPNSIITDLGTQFIGTTFWDFCDDRGIVIKYVSVAHPRANGQVERANGMIIDALKKRLYTENDRAPGRWMKEPWSGASELRPVEAQEYLPTSWSTAPRQSCRLTQPSDLLGLNTSTRRQPTTPENSKSTAWRKSV